MTWKHASGGRLHCTAVATKTVASVQSFASVIAFSSTTTLATTPLCWTLCFCPETLVPHAQSVSESDQSCCFRLDANTARARAEWTKVRTSNHQYAAVYASGLKNEISCLLSLLRALALAMCSSYKHYTLQNVCAACIVCVCFDRP